MCSARQAAVIAATFAVLATAQPAAAETCLRMVVSASGSTSMWNKEELARTSAIAAWPAAASETAGADYASWGGRARQDRSVRPGNQEHRPMYCEGDAVQAVDLICRFPKR